MSKKEKHIRLRQLAHDVATKGPKNWRRGLLEELRQALPSPPSVLVPKYKLFVLKVLRIPYP